MPAPLEWIEIMDRVGGYLAYKALEYDERAYEDVILAIRGEVQARKIAGMKAAGSG